MTTSRTPLPPGAQAREFVDAYPPEDSILHVARGLAHEVGLTPVAPAAGAALRLLAAAGAAKSVVEIGTGTGVSGVWLLRGMRPDGVLTTIDVESEHQRMARRIFAEAGFAPSRTRIITDRALDVLPRLADGAYDLIFSDGDPEDHDGALAAALRLLRPGGILAVNGAINGTVAVNGAPVLREVAKAVRDADEWVPALLPVGDGLLAAVKH